MSKRLRRRKLVVGPVEVLRVVAGDSHGELYLTAIPPTANAELLVFDWVSMLREQTDTAGAPGAIRYYTTLDWITPDVADDLTTRVVGLRGPTSDCELRVEDHLTSLRYVARLASL